MNNNTLRRNCQRGTCRLQVPWDSKTHFFKASTARISLVFPKGVKWLSQTKIFGFPFHGLGRLGSEHVLNTSVHTLTVPSAVDVRWVSRSSRHREVLLVSGDWDPLFEVWRPKRCVGVSLGLVKIRDSGPRMFMMMSEDHRKVEAMINVC